MGFLKVSNIGIYLVRVQLEKIPITWNIRRYHPFIPIRESDLLIQRGISRNDPQKSPVRSIGVTLSYVLLLACHEPPSKSTYAPIVIDR